MSQSSFFGSAHGLSPKISPVLFSEAISDHTNGTTTRIDQPIRTVWEKTLTGLKEPSFEPTGWILGASCERVPSTSICRVIRAPQYSIRSRRVARSITAAMSKVRKKSTTPIADA